MKVTLISFDQELFCLGMRILSACLRKAGHRVQCIFLPPKATKNFKLSKFQMEYSANLLDTIRSVCSDSNLIGMSLMTNQFIQAVNLTQYLKAHKVSAPIIWGGIEPTVEPKVCLEYADIVCLGEGEDALLELAKKIEQGEPYQETMNFWFNLNGTAIKNPVRPLVENLDILPLPDYSCKDHYYGLGDRFETLTRERLISFKGERFRSFNKKICYPVMTSRGCLFACSYCCNSVYEHLYSQQKRLRFRSAANVISELEMIEEMVAPLDSVIMVDDNFTARPARDLKKFCEEYKQKIGKPFYCQVSPLTINEEKMDILIEHGCVKVTMGVETVNERIAAMYNRAHFHKVVHSSIALLERYRSKMRLPPTYQFIIDNPYETVEETIETLRFATECKKPWDNPVYSLMLFPGTPLYQKAKEEGIVGDPHRQIYGRNWLDQSKPFFQFWILLYRANCPVFFLRILLYPLIARLMTTHLASAIWRTRFFCWLWNKPT